MEIIQQDFGSLIHEQSLFIVAGVQGDDDMGKDDEP